MNSEQSDKLKSAIFLMEKGQNSDAQKILKEIIQVDPKNTKAWAVFIKTLQTTEQKIKALEHFKKFNPENKKADSLLKNLKGDDNQLSERDSKKDNSIFLHFLHRIAQDKRLKLIFVSITIMLVCLVLIVVLSISSKQSDIQYAIPGITYSEVSNYLRGMGIYCETNKPTTVSTSKHCEGSFESGSLIVEVDIASPKSDPEKIKYIYSEVDQYHSNYPSVKKAGQILAQIAAMPFGNSASGAAKAWVQNHVASIQTHNTPIYEPKITLAGIDLSMSGIPPTSIWLFIENLELP